MLGGVSFVAHLAMELASPDLARYGGNVGEGGQADYGLWPFGAFLPPINPAAIEAAESDSRATDPAVNNLPPGSPVPVAVIDAPTATPTPPLVTAEPLATTDTAPAAEEPSPTPTATRTATPLRAPTQPPAATSTRAPATITPAQPSATPVTNPGGQLPTSAPTSAPVRTNTPAPASPTRAATTPANTPTSSITPKPVASPTPVPPSPTPSPTPQPTPEITFVDAAITGSERYGATFQVRLSATYSQTVTVNYTTSNGTAWAGSDYIQNSGILTFAPGQTVKSISIELQQDNLNELNETLYLTLSDPLNAILGNPQIGTLTITDDDPPPTVRFASASQTVPERGSVAATIMLNQVSDIPVVVPYTVGGTADPNNDYSLRAGSVTIPARQTTVRLRFPISDDQRDEDNETVEIRLGTPSNADLVTPEIFTVTITDDDTAGVRVVTNTTTVVEGGAITYTVRLTSEPVSQVSVRMLPDNQLGAAPVALTFNAVNWATPQVVTVTAIDDYVDEADTHPGRVRHEVRSFDASYEWDQARASTLDVVVNVLDNDTAGVELLTNSTTVFEGQSITYTLRLTSQPTDTVTIALLPNDQVTVAPAPSLTFTAANWNRPQTVTVTTIDDFIDEDAGVNWPPHDGVVAHTLASADRNYNQGTLPFTVNPVTVTIIDNDEAGVTVLPVNLTLAEGGAGTTYAVMLTSQPTDLITITLQPDAQVTVGPNPTLVFTPANWAETQTVTVTAVDDSVDEDLDLNLTPHTGVIRHVVTSGDPLYANLQAPYPPDDVTVAITDNDEAGVDLVVGATTVTEGGAATYTLRLRSQPIAPVTISLAATATGSITPVLPAPVIFTAATWMTPATITVGVPDNFIDEIHDAPTFTVTHAGASADPNYDGVADTFTLPAIPVTVLDDDIAGVTVTPVNLTATEGGAGDTYDVVLRSQPTAPVTIGLVPDAQVTVGPTPALIFDATNWDQPQTVTVTAVDDVVDEDLDIDLTPHIGAISHTVTSADPFYASLPPAELPADVSVSISDNDEAGLEVLPADLTLSEVAGLNTGTLSVSLRSQPRAPVTVTLAPDAQVTVGPIPTLVFDDTNWNVIQTVTVTTVDDAINEVSPHAGTIGLSSTSTDLPFNQAWPAYSLNVADDDIAVVGVSAPTSLVTTESGGVSSFTVWLNSQPTSPVTVPITSSNPGEATVSAAPASTLPLVFDASNWMTPVVVTVTGVDDPDFDGQQSYSIAIGPAQSLDPFYDGLAAAQPSINLHNNDNEPALASVGDPLPLSEGTNGNAVMSFPVTLARAPLVTVTVDYTTADLTATGGTDYLPATGTITFAPGMTSTLIPVSIYGDALVEPNEDFTLRLTGATAVGDLTGLDDNEATGVIVNDDSLLSAGQFIYTGGILTVAADGYYYNGGANGIGYTVITVPCNWPLNRPLSFELWSPAIDAGAGGDAANGGGAGPTMFELLAMGGTGIPVSIGGPGLFPATAGAPSWELFRVVTPPQPCGEYLLITETSGDDVNAWSIRVGYDHDTSLATAPDPVVPGTTDHVVLGVLQTTVAHQAAGTATTAWLYVSASMTELRLRNFDLDTLPGPGADLDARVRYYAPSAVYDPLGLNGGVVGTGSGDGAWSADDIVVNPEVGWWRVVIYTSVPGNRYVLEATDQDDDPLMLRYDPPS